MILVEVYEILILSLNFALLKLLLNIQFVFKRVSSNHIYIRHQKSYYIYMCLLGDSQGSILLKQIYATGSVIFLALSSSEILGPCPKPLLQVGCILKRAGHALFLLTKAYSFIQLSVYRNILIGFFFTVDFNVIYSSDIFFRQNTKTALDEQTLNYLEMFYPW